MHDEVRGRGRRPRAALSSLGLLGGTFNPPHIGHVVCAAEAREALGLDRVALLPAASPPHKAVPDDPGVALRLQMCRLAVVGHEGLEVLDREVARGGASYTVDTLRALHADGTGDDLTFIVGGDMALSLPTWREPDELLRLARLGVAEREGADRVQIVETLASLGAPDRIEHFRMPRIEVSSSEIRGRVRSGRRIDHLVAGAVAELIAERGLYR